MSPNRSRFIRRKRVSSAPAATARLLQLRQPIVDDYLELPSLEAVLVFDHVHALTAELHASHLEPHALLRPRFELELDLATGADHALPWQSFVRPPQQLRHVTVIQRISRSGSHLPISCHFALPSRSDPFLERRVALLTLL